MSASCMSHLCHGWISPLNMLIFGRFAFVLYSGGVSFKMALPSHPSQSLWLDFQILISSTAFTHCVIHTHTHTHTPLNLDSKMTHSFYSLHRCKGFLPSFLGLLEEGEHILASCSEGLCSTCPHPSPSFFCLVPLCPSSSTLICHHPTHIFLSHIQSIVPCTT